MIEKEVTFGRPSNVWNYYYCYPIYIHNGSYSRVSSSSAIANPSPSLGHTIVPYCLVLCYIQRTTLKMVLGQLYLGSVPSLVDLGFDWVSNYSSYRRRSMFGTAGTMKGRGCSSDWWWPRRDEERDSTQVVFCFEVKMEWRAKSGNEMKMDNEWIGSRIWFSGSLINDSDNN